MPILTLSPPEGNMTFIDGMTWCVARPGASQEDLQNALDWACGAGGADCSPLQPGGRCYQPDTVLTHASYAFNIFYQQNGNSDIACNFGGTGAIVKRDPSSYQSNLVHRSVSVLLCFRSDLTACVILCVFRRFRFMQVPGIRVSIVHRNICITAGVFFSFLLQVAHLAW
jgi:hypothetical protein